MGKLIIGCKKCYEEIKNKKGFLYTKEGLVRIPFTVNTAFTIHDLYELFLEGYTCFFCEKTLIFTANMMEFANDFINENYHIIFKTEFIHIINENEEIKIHLEHDINKILEKKIFSSNKKDLMPSIDEIKVFLSAAKDIDLNQWFFYINSNQLQPYYPFCLDIKNLPKSEK